MDTKKLRQKILDLAIRGKLVPQDPNDEPASVLLERIRAEKERLIAEGKIKRPKKSKASSSESHYQQLEPLFPIPDSWEWVTIADICSKIGSGSTPKGSNYSLDGIPFFRSQNVYNEGLVYTDIKYISEITHKSMISTEVIAGDLLLNITGGSLGRCTVVPDNFSRGNVSQHVCILRPLFVLPHFFHCLILSSYFKKAMNLTGSGREGLPKYNLEVMNFPLPPIEEQKRIVATVRTFMKILNLLDSSKASLCDEICKAKSKILDLAMQGKLVPQDPADESAADMLLRINPKAKIITDNPHYPRWVSAQLGEVCDFERGITFPSVAKEHTKTTNNIACLRTANIHDEVDLSSLWFIDKSFLKGNYNKLIRLGDIIMSTANSRELVGRSVIINTCDEEMTFGGFVTVIRTSILDPAFLQLFLKYKTMRGDFSKIATQTTNIANLNTKILSNVYISFPCLMEQKRIVAKIEELYSVLDEIEASLQS